MLAAKAQLDIAIPAAILVLLMMHFGRMDRTLMVMLSLPVALVGGHVGVVSCRLSSLRGGRGRLYRVGGARRGDGHHHDGLHRSPRAGEEPHGCGATGRSGARGCIDVSSTRVHDGDHWIFRVVAHLHLRRAGRRCHAPHCAADGWRHDYHRHFDPGRHPCDLLSVGGAGVQAICVNSVKA